MPLGDLDFGVSYENQHQLSRTRPDHSHNPGGISETEILLAYGGVHFASKMGSAGRQSFITLTSGMGEPEPHSARPCCGRARKKSAFEEV